MELHRFFRYAIEKMCKEKKSLNHFNIEILKTIIKTYYGVFHLTFQSKIPIFTPLEQGKFLSEKYRNEAGAEPGAFLGRFL